MLPHDVWLNIARFVPILALRNLYAVNAALFHIALDARYRQISFIYWDDRLLRNLIRLKDPYIARRVKILHIYPGFLKEVMDRRAESKDASSPAKPPLSLRVRLTDIAQQLRDVQDRVFPPSRPHADRNGSSGSSSSPQNLYDLPPRQGIEKLRERLKTPQDVMHAVLDLLRSLPSVTDYYVTWYGLPTALPFADSAASLPDSDALSLTNLAVPLIGTPLLAPSLTKLSLDISLENIHALCSASFHVARLEHLSLHLHSDHQLSPASLKYILHTRLARSVSNLSPFLRLFSIEAHEPMDIGPLFDGLDLMEKLDTLALALPLQKPHLGNPYSLGRFLRRQTETIKVLRLRATQHDAGGTGSASHWRRIDTPDPWSLHSWVRSAFGSEIGQEHQEWLEDNETAEPLGEYDMEALESLEVSSNHMPLETALYCAERFGAKVKTLGLLGSSKSFEFVKEVVKVLAHTHRRRPSPSSRATLNAVVEEEGEPDEAEEDVIWQWLTPSPVSTAEDDEDIPTANTNLRSLRLGPVPFSPQLMDLLAANLPRLQHLELIVKHFLPSQDDVPIYGPHKLGRGDGDGTQLEEQVYEFLETMQNDWAWPCWGLKTIAVYTDSAALSMPLALSIPSPAPTVTNHDSSKHHHPSPALATSKDKLAPITTFTVSLPSSISSKGSVSSSSTATVTMGRRNPSQSSVTLHVPHSSSAPISRSPSASGGSSAPLSSSTSALPLPSSLPLPSLQPPPFQSASTPASPIGMFSTRSTLPPPALASPSTSTPSPSRPHVFSFLRTRSKLRKDKEKDKAHASNLRGERGANGSSGWNSDAGMYNYSNIGLGQDYSTNASPRRSQSQRRRDREQLEDIWWPDPNRSKNGNTRRRNRDPDDRRRRRRNKPVSSFGSISSGTSSVGVESENSEYGYGSGREDGRGAAGAAIIEEKITLEVALADVLSRCLPGVRVVR